ncbi:LOW QUALITY PROTEIN: protein lava lamp [Drosophila tropicalis]|uniref:LOW QUALITY PROTEIN: protein lava lamp n=1 Tax=Drosophila tropicalis TaxID=46794 RepID=UPI0035ABEFCE
MEAQSQDPSAKIEMSSDPSTIQHGNEGPESDINEIIDSSIDLSQLQNISSSTTTASGGKGRLNSLRQNLTKQQERLTALRERALRKSENDEHRKSNLSDSMESLKHLGQKLQKLKTRGTAARDSPATTTSKHNDDEHLDVSSQQLEVVSGSSNGSGSEKLLMLTQRTEQTRALLEQRKRDLAKSLLSIKTMPSPLNTEMELGSSMTDLREMETNPMSRHRSAVDLQNPQTDQNLEESRLKFLKNKMKLTELKQTRQDQEMQEMRQELDRRSELIKQLEVKGNYLQLEVEKLRHQEKEEDASSISHSLQDQERNRLQSEIGPLRQRLSELETINDMLESTREELQKELIFTREQLQQQREEESTDSQVNIELAKQLKELQQQLNQLQKENEKLHLESKLEVNDSSISERLLDLETQIHLQSSQLEEQKSFIENQKEELAEKSTELNVLNVNLRLLEEKLAKAQSSSTKSIFLVEDKGEGEEELHQLKQKLDESNKINIKLKLKCKQSEKQLEKLQQSQDLKQLADENEQLQQRICVLEDEKGQWQLKGMSEEESESNQQAQEHIYQIQTLQKEKDELEKKLSHYINENMELLDKLEKLSSSASSAESIEIVERPLPAEQELDATGDCYGRPASEGDVQDINNVLRKFVSEPTQTDLSPEQEELEFFASERHEVLQKLERLMAENSDLQSKLEKEQREKDSLSQQLMEKSSNSSNLSQELSSMQRSSEVVAALDVGNGGSELVEKCQRCLNRLHLELEAYGKANDRNAKFNVVKKLAKEARQVYVQLTELLQKVKEASTAVETVTVVETVVAVTAPNGKALAEYEQLTAQNSRLKEEINRLSRELEEQQLPIEALADQQKEEINQELQSEISELRHVIDDLRLSESEHLQLIASQSAQLTQIQVQSEQFENLLNSKEMNHEKQMEQQSRLRHELESRQESLEAELVVLQTLVAEQKRQLIENLGENEHKMNLKGLEIQSLQEELHQIRLANKEEQHQLKINKSLAAQQVEEISSQQETIDGLKKEILQLQQTIAQSKQEEQTKIKDLKEKLKKYAANLKKRNQDYVELEEKMKDLPEPTKECPDLILQLEQLHQQNQKLNDELKAKIHTNLEQRDTVRQLKTQIIEQEQEQQRLQVELQNVIQANTDLRLEQTQWENEFAGKQHLEQLRLDQDELIKDLQHQLEQKTLKFDKSKEVIKHRNASIQSLQKQIQELSSQKPKDEMFSQAKEELASCRAELEGVRENFKETISGLETLNEGIQAKLQQNESYIEILETQNAELQERNAALEDRSASIALELSKAQNYIQQLEQKFEEESAQRKELERQIIKQSQEFDGHKQEHTTQIAEMLQWGESNREQVSDLQATIKTLQLEQQNLIEKTKSERDHLEQDSKQYCDQVIDLQQQLSHRELEIQRQRQVYDAKLAAKVTELDEMECDLNAHIERSTSEVRDLHQQLERSQEEMSEVERERSSLSREVMRLRLQQDSAEQDSLELQELRMQVMQDKNEMDHLKSQIDSLCANHAQELQLMQQQIAEMDTLGQNQTDDQMFLETENKRLIEQVTEMQGRLQVQSEQLHNRHTTDLVVSGPETSSAPAPSMFFAADEASLNPTPFDEIVTEPTIERVSNQNLAANSAASDFQLSLLPSTIEDLQRNVSDLEKHAQDLENKLLVRNQSLAEQERRLLELEQLLGQRDEELAQLKESQRLNEIEKLIIQQQPSSDLGSTAAAPLTTLGMFFKTSDTDLKNPPKDDFQFDVASSAVPVDEPLIVPERTYLCYPEEQVSQHDPELGVDEDPWALASTQASVSLAASDPVLDFKVSQLEQKLAKAEQEKSEANLKTAKLIKRLKEYKSKLQSTPTVSQDNDLDGAIIDELKNQLKLQELSHAKTVEQLQHLNLEKEKLTKRIDILTAGNERMAELKERQDMDVYMYQARIRELQEKLQQMDNWESAPIALVLPPDDEKTKKLENLQAENLDLNNECQDLQGQLEHQKQQLEQAKELTSRTQQERDELLRKLQQLEEKMHDCEISSDIKVKKLEEQLLEPSVTNQEHATQIALLQEREAEIVHLKQRIEDLMREDQTEKLVFEILTKNQELQMLRMQIKQLEEDKLEENSNRETLLPAPETQLQMLISENTKLQSEKSDMEEELRVLNNHVLSTLEIEDRMKQTVLELDTKNIEITELRKSLELIQQTPKQHQPQAQSDLELQLATLNKQWESVVEQKCGEVAATWQKHLFEKEEAFEKQLEELQQKQQSPQFTPIAVEGDNNEIVLKMQKALETQEMEIVTLKEQLAIRSAEYARLAAQYDPFRLQNRQDGGDLLDTPKTSNDPLPEYVLKTDLDYALMMLHQRDMRVEEMIVELVQLLEERDHLQLKLSDTLRQLETERSNRRPSIELTSASLNQAINSPFGKTTDNSADSSTRTASTASGPVINSSSVGSDLNQKLAELQTVKHFKDKAIVDEREQRLQQMIQLQRDMAKQSSSVATTPSLPTPTMTIPTATEPQTADVDQSQPSLRSPSMVLMDWLMGSHKNDEEDKQQQSTSN